MHFCHTSFNSSLLWGYLVDKSSGEKTADQVCFITLGGWSLVLLKQWNIYFCQRSYLLLAMCQKFKGLSLTVSMDNCSLVTFPTVSDETKTLSSVLGCTQLSHNHDCFCFTLFQPIPPHRNSISLLGASASTAYKMMM